MSTEYCRVSNRLLSPIVHKLPFPSASVWLHVILLCLSTEFYYTLDYSEYSPLFIFFSFIANSLFDTYFIVVSVHLTTNCIVSHILLQLPYSRPAYYEPAITLLDTRLLSPLSFICPFYHVGSSIKQISTPYLPSYRVRYLEKLTSFIERHFSRHDRLASLPQYSSIPSYRLSPLFSSSYFLSQPSPERYCLEFSIAFNLLELEIYIYLFLFIHIYTLRRGPS